MSDINFYVDKDKCIHCGLCIKDCITGVLSFDENKIPLADAPERCIKCQHCFSVCPTGAVSIFNKSPQNSDKIYSQNPDMLLNLIQSRRSIRQFKYQNIDSEKLQKLKAMLNYVPTGCNYHRLHFSFIDDVKIMEEFRKYVNEKLVKALTKTPVKSILNKFSKYKNAIENGEDVIFRGAPHLIVAANSVNAPCAKEDAIIALSYFELYAQSMDIGTCWCGFAQICMLLFPELSQYLNIPEGYKPEYVMLFGSKDINYLRTIQPENCSIVSAQSGSFDDMPVMGKIKRYFWNFIR